MSKGITPEMEAEMIRRGAKVTYMNLPSEEHAPLSDKPNKYRAKATVVDGIRFASRKEAKRYGELKMMQAAGEVKWFTCQVPFRLDGGTVYRADFLVVWWNGNVTVEDAKGYRTQVYFVKRREVEAKYGFTIQEV